jgi:hypothetical protein
LKDRTGGRCIARNTDTDANVDADTHTHIDAVHGKRNIGHVKVEPIERATSKIKVITTATST